MKPKKTDNSKDGAALIAVMIFVILVGIFGMTRLSSAKMAAIEAHRYIAQEQSEFLAEMGHNYIRAILTQEGNRIRPEYLGLVVNQGEQSLDDQNVFDDEGNLIGAFRVAITYPTDEDPPEAHYVVKSTGISPDNEELETITSYIQLTTVSKFIMGSNDDGGVVYPTGDIIRGSIMSNGPFWFSGNPIVEGVVLTAEAYNYINGSASSATPENIFKSGGYFNVPEIDFDSELIDELGSNAAQTFPNGTSIVFSGDTYSVTEYVETTEEVTVYTYWQYVRRGRWGGGWQEFTSTEYPSGDAYWISESTQEQTVTTEQTTTYFIDDLGQSTFEDNIIYIDGTVTVSGDVGGIVSVVASDSINVDGGIVYTDVKDNPNPSNWSEYYMPSDGQRLGLYAKHKVMALPDRYQDFNICASIFVSEPSGGTGDSYLRGFCVYGYRDYMGTPYINLYGSIVQNRRGAVGTTGGGGFLKNYYEDPRFAMSPPPGSPMASSRFFGWKLEKKNQS